MALKKISKRIVSYPERDVKLKIKNKTRKKSVDFCAKCGMVFPMIKDTTTKEQIMYNWKPVVRSFIETAQENGLKLHKVSDGEEVFTTDSIDETIDVVTSVDESTICFKGEDGKFSKVYIVLGNGPEEIVCDCTDNEIMDKVCEKHYDKWQNLETPTS